MRLPSFAHAPGRLAVSSARRYVSAPAMIESLPPLLGGRYRPIRLLKRGGVGAVYEVEHAHTGQHFALKVLRDRAFAEAPAIERFRREARVSARIKSDHVVRVIDADVAAELGGAPYLVMELLVGEDLGRTCGDTPQVPDRVIGWLRQVTKALDKAHALGIVHRDLKPENLFLASREDGTSIVKILDFGIAKATLEGGASTTSGEILGTPLFMAPEQAELDAGQVTPRADLFALGLIAHKLLTGRHYWQCRFFVQLVREICLQPMALPSERGSTHGRAFDAWFARACHRDPAQRFESASAQVDALAAALRDAHSTDGVVRVSSHPITSWSGGPLRRRGLRPALVIAMLAAASVGTLVVLRPATLRSAATEKGALAPATVPGIAPALPVVPSVSVASEGSAASSVAPPGSASTTPAVAAALAVTARPRTPAGPTASARGAAPRDPWADQK
jgi:eukaryotic-like serine/threonine-protein kinase